MEIDIAPGRGRSKKNDMQDGAMEEGEISLEDGEVLDSVTKDPIDNVKSPDRAPRERSSPRRYTRRSPTNDRFNRTSPTRSPPRSPERNPSPKPITERVLRDGELPEPVIEPFEREIDKHWKVMETLEGQADFGNWTKLLQLADKLTKIEETRKAYDRFLTEFPLCYVYWKKYADHEVKKGTDETVRAVYERGLTAGIPHSVDLWTYYCTYVAEQSEDLEEIRSLFERALSIVSIDFASHPLWDKYIEFEMSQEEYKRVAAIYVRILKIPLEQINSYWERYKLFVSERPLHISTVGDELKSISSAGLNNEEKRKNWLLSEREKVFLVTSEEANARRTYEKEVLKISYFHVRPLDHAQLVHWDEYLKFEEKQGNRERIIKLYERCIIPCSNYPKFWYAYIDYIENRSNYDEEGRNVQEARRIFERATNIFLKKRPDLYFAHAVFEEFYGKIDRARLVFERMRERLPFHIEGTLRYICLEKRQGNAEKCGTLYKEAIESPQAEEYHKVFLYIHYGRLAKDLMLGDPTKSREIFDEALTKFPHFKDLWLAYVLFEKTLAGYDVEERVSSIFSKAVASTALSETEKQTIYSEWTQFLSENGSVANLRKLMSDFRGKSDEYTFYGQSGAQLTAQKRTHETAFGASVDENQGAKYNKAMDYSQYQSAQGDQAVDYNSYYQNYYDSYAYAAAYGQMIAQGLFSQQQQTNQTYEGGY
jgi:pre-mRNA-processing factor 39